MSRRFAGFAKACAALLAALAAPAAGGPLKSVTISASASGGSVEIAAPGMSGAPALLALDGPRRLVIDLPGVSADMRNLPGGGAVSKVRTAQFDAGTARVVLDLASPAKVASSAAGDGKLILTLATVSEAEFAKAVAAGRRKLDAPKPVEAAAPKPVAAAAKPVVSAPRPATAKVDPPASLAAPKPPPVRVAAAPAPQPRAPPARPRVRTGLPVVVIDAGHGGKDVGAVSVLGPAKYEKDVVLAVAKAIKKELDASGRVRAILTRSDDRYLRHRDRFELARRNRAELFISVHADSAPVPDASGATVYTLSETASDAEAARLAAKENRSDIIAGVDLGIETSEVSDILIDLAQRETMNTAAAFAATLQRELRQDIKVRSQFHRFAGFLVLKAPDVPSVLLETGYLSNETDSRFLFSPAGQARIAKGVRRAVEGHFLRRLAQR